MSWLTGPITKNVVRTALLAGLIYLSIQRAAPLHWVIILAVLVIVLWLISAYEQYSRGK